MPEFQGVAEIQGVRRLCIYLRQISTQMIRCQ